MTGTVDLNPNHLATVEAILAEHVPECEVRAFGSRATWTARDYSDLDLAVVGEGPLDWRTLSRLKEAFEESDLPMRVDVLDWHAISQSFRKMIERDYAVVQEGDDDGKKGGWQMRTLGELTDNFDAIRVPIKRRDRHPGPHPYYGASGVVDHVSGFLFDGQYLLVAEDGENLRTRTMPIAFLANGKFWVNNHAHIVRGNSDADTRFLMYALADLDISGYLTGSTMPKLTQGNMNRIELLTPPLPEQRAIARVLGTLDDKIELNRRMNETLEEMARALFKSWFVDFEPVRAKMEGRWRRGESLPGLPAEHYDLFPDRLVPSELGDIPEGWEVKPLGELVHTTKGRSYRSGELKESATALVTLKSFARGGGYRPDGLKPYVGPFKAEQTISPGEIVISCTDVTQAAEVIGRPAIVEASPLYKTLVASLDTLIVRPNPELMSPEFLYLLTSTPQFTSHTYAHATGTTVLHLAKGAVPSFRFAAPKSQILTAFDALVAPVFTRARRIQQDLHLLTSQRDTLLPGLVTGQVGVRNEDD